MNFLPGYCDDKLPPDLSCALELMYIPHKMLPHEYDAPFPIALNHQVKVFLDAGNDILGRWPYARKNPGIAYGTPAYHHCRTPGIRHPLQRHGMGADIAVA